MADETKTQPAQQTQAQKQNASEELKPVGKWTTGLAKTAAAVGVAISAAYVAAGVMAMVKKKSLAPILMEVREAAGHNPFQNVEQAEKSVGRHGLGAAAVGTALLAGSAATWKAASAATRARNYSQLSDQLNAKEAGVSR